MSSNLIDEEESTVPLSQDEGPMPDRTMPERVAEVIAEGNWTDAEVARKLRVSRGAVGHWRHGSVKNMSVEATFGLAKLAQVRPEWLALGELPKREHSKPSGGIIQVAETEQMYAYYVTKEEHELLQAYRRLTPEQQQNLHSNAQFLLTKSAPTIEALPIKKKQ